MTIKEKMLHVVSELPDDASVEDAMEKLLGLAQVERGLAQADRGETLSHQEVKERMQKWLLKSDTLGSRRSQSHR